MNTNKEKIRKELSILLQDGKFLLYDEAINNGKLSEEQEKVIKEAKGYKKFKKENITNKSAYQKWFAKSYNVVKQILPDRHQEFYKLYQEEKRRTKDIDFTNYTISDYFLGLFVTKGWDKVEVVNPFRAFF